MCDEINLIEDGSLCPPALFASLSVVIVTEENRTARIMILEIIFQESC